MQPGLFPGRFRARRPRRLPRAQRLPDRRHHLPAARLLGPHRRSSCRPFAAPPVPAASGCIRSRTSSSSRSSSVCSTPASRCRTSASPSTTCASAACADLAKITLFSDGTTVYECTSAEEVVDLLQGGQGVFGIAVSGAMRELTGTIADFPAERADGGASEQTPRGRTGVAPQEPRQPQDRLARVHRTRAACAATAAVT